MNLLIDPPKSLYLTLLIATILTAAVCANFQTRRTFIAFLVCAALLLGLFLIDTFVESPREEASRRMLAMADAATNSNVKSFLEHVSKDFNAGGKTKADLEGSPAWGLIRQYNAKIIIAGLNRDDCRELNDREIEIGFMAKAEAADGLMLKYARAVFVKDGESWKMKSIKFYSPLNTENPKEEPVPGFP